MYHLSGVHTSLVPEPDEQFPFESIHVPDVVLLQGAHLGVGDVSVSQEQRLQGLGTEEGGNLCYFLIT